MAIYIFIGQRVDARRVGFIHTNSQMCLWQNKSNVLKSVLCSKHTTKIPSAGRKVSLIIIFDEFGPILTKVRCWISGAVGGLRCDVLVEIYTDEKFNHQRQIYTTRQTTKIRLRSVGLSTLKRGAQDRKRDIWPTAIQRHPNNVSRPALFKGHQGGVSH